MRFHRQAKGEDFEGGDGKVMQHEFVTFMEHPEVLQAALADSRGRRLQPDDFDAEDEFTRCVFSQPNGSWAEESDHPPLLLTRGWKVG